MVHIALQAAEALAGEDIEVEVVDLRTLIPFDSATCVASVQRTGRLVVLQEGHGPAGWATRCNLESWKSAFTGLNPPRRSSERSIRPCRFHLLGESHHPSLEHVVEMLRASFKA